MILTLRDKTQLDSLRNILAAHGKTWNVLKDRVLPGSLVRLIKELAFDAEEVYDSTIRMLSPFIEALDRETWPAELNLTTVKLNPYQLQNVDGVRWGLIKALRYSKPTRLAEGADHCQKMLDLALVFREYSNVLSPGSRTEPLEVEDPQVFLYAGVSRAYNGDDNLRAERVLIKGLCNLGSIGAKNPLWGMSALELALRAQKKDAQADQWENKIVNFVHARPGKYLDSSLEELLLRPGETTNRILKRCLDTPVEPTLASQNRTERFCAACLDPGYQEDLKTCSKCKAVWYCSKECQLSHWKEHKRDCSSMSDLTRKLEEVALVPKQRTAPAIYDAMKKWTEAMKPVVRDACIAALKLGSTSPLNMSHILFIEAEWAPHARQVLSMFNITSTTVITRAQINATDPGLLATMDAAIREQPKRQHEVHWSRALVRVREKGKPWAGLQDALLNFHPTRDLATASPDPDWINTLKAKQRSQSSAI